MSAVSKNVTPASSAASTTAVVPAWSTRPPKLLQPSPTTDTSSGPSARVRIRGGYRFARVRYWEDFRVGEVTELEPVDVTREEIVEFARRFDPQPFHVDEAAAAAGPFGGLVASGWDNTALFMGLFLRAILLHAAAIGSAG